MYRIVVAFIHEETGMCIGADTWVCDATMFRAFKEEYEAKRNYQVSVRIRSVRSLNE